MPLGAFLFFVLLPINIHGMPQGIPFLYRYFMMKGEFHWQVKEMNAPSSLQSAKSKSVIFAGFADGISKRAAMEVMQDMLQVLKTND